MASDWWNTEGVCKPLHSMNRLRVPFVRDRLVPNNRNALPLQGLKILDVGCGGGILSEPLARLGAKVTAVDACKENIDIAKFHSVKDEATKEINYICSTIEEFAESQEDKFDAIVASEIIEYVIGLLPKGTHDWNKFLKPEEIEEMCDNCGMGTRLVNGMTYIPVFNKWLWIPDKSVNFALHAIKYTD